MTEIAFVNVMLPPGRKVGLTTSGGFAFGPAS
jgi:hypothetical protein